jgi:hypothetical protein
VTVELVDADAWGGSEYVGEEMKLVIGLTEARRISRQLNSIEPEVIQETRYCL